MAEIIDIAVVCACPCGLAVGVAAKLADLSCVLFDKANVVSAISRYPTHMKFFSTAAKLEIGVDPEPEALQKVIAERLGFRLVDHRMELYGVAIDRKRD